MTHRPGRRSRHSRPAALAGLLVLLLMASMPAVVSAHAVLIATDPPAGGSVEGTPGRIVATFNEPLGEKSTVSLRNAAGERVLVGAVDPADRTSLVMEPETLEAGTYEVRWTAESDDGDLVRGTYRFTVTAAAPSPSPSPSAAVPPSRSPSGPPNAAASDAPSSIPPTSSPAPSASPAGGEPAATGGDVLLPIVSALALLAVLALFLFGRRRPSARP
jgi:methionine-rich copper-binding protein CopC